MMFLATPVRITEQFGVASLTIDGRNEVRAVYGGFGLAISAILLVGLFEPGLRSGICFTVAVALGGMAVGRLISVAVDRSFGRFPKFYCIIEIAAALLLWGAA